MCYNVLTLTLLFIYFRLESRVELQGSKTVTIHKLHSSKLESRVKLQGSKTSSRVAAYMSALESRVELQGLSERKTKSEQKENLNQKILIKVFCIYKR